MLKILILAETIDPANSSAGKANHSFIVFLSKNFDVKAYHFSQKEISIPNVETILIKEKKTDIYYFFSRAQRVFQRISGINISKSLENRFGFSFTFKNDANSMADALKNENPAAYNLIITLSKGASYRTHATLLKLPQWHHKWLAYIHDPYPFHWYPPPYEWTEAGHKQKEKFFLMVAQKAKWLGYPSQLLAEWMAQFNPLFLDKAVILPHQMPTHEQIENQTLPDFFERKKFTVLHAGNLLKQRNPFPLIKAWKMFREEIPEARDNSQLLLIGPSTYHQPKLSKVCGADPSIYLSDGNMPHHVVLAMEQAASANIILEAASETSPFLPAKFPSLVKANRPIIHLGPKNSESRRLLGQAYEMAATADDVDAIKKMLSKCYLNWKLEITQLDRKDLENYFSSHFLKKQMDYICEKTE
ncbi:glycosyltransferase family protein [Aequorivita echinoideorum]|uniref:UDP-glycosyltransferase n=1 Tax=Aequorivita echinoideorum TaxID=1549647 RepID=A0ABS5S5F3_9FLAO|nr:UDP-glycosyltransferase [Aequorivita echinoideorum]MBT0608452.1 UDP-glycosyltransferase [Aequorivita echinoideorum]